MVRDGLLILIQVDLDGLTIEIGVNTGQIRIRVSVPRRKRREVRSRRVPVRTVRNYFSP